METTNIKNTATVIHLSTLTQYFFPFGNFILPVVIWSSTKKNSDFIERHGRQAINFQLSIFLYTVILCLVAIPTLMFTIFKDVSIRELSAHGFLLEDFSIGKMTSIAIAALVPIALFFLMKAAEFFLVIYAAVKAANGEPYDYPMTIAFIKADTRQEPTISTAGPSSE